MIALRPSIATVGCIDDDYLLDRSVFEEVRPKSRLKANDEYRSKPQIVFEIIREIQAVGFVIERVLADSLYGESGNLIEVLHPLKLPYIVAIRSNLGVLMP